MSLNIVLIGAGAIGAFYGSKLGRAGHRVAVVARSGFEVIREHGYQIDSHWGDFHFQPDEVVQSAEEVTFTPDVVLVGLKVLPEIDTVEIIRPLIGPKTAIMLIQNGIEIEAPIKAAYPDNELISALAFICVWRKNPSHIVHQDVGRIKFGNYPSGISTLCKTLSDAFESAGVPVELTDRVRQARWEKLVWNAPFNPISVLGGGVNTKQMLGDPETAKLCREVMDEVLTLAEAVGEPLSVEIAENNMAYTEAMAPYYTSMCLDFAAKRPLEVEAILGNAVRIGREMQVHIPCLETLYGLLRQVDQFHCRGKAS